MIPVAAWTPRWLVIGSWIPNRPRIAIEWKAVGPAAWLLIG